MANKNSRAEEDALVTVCYKQVSTQTDVVTDQNGDTFWEKVAEIFNQKIANKTDFVQIRTSGAIKGRWGNTIQKALLKYAGCLNKALSEYHSGCSWDDYYLLAKKFYAADKGSTFSYDLCWYRGQNLTQICYRYQHDERRPTQGVKVRRR